MARFEFKQATLLKSGPAGVGGKHLILPKGVHEVSDEAQKHPTFVHFAKAGLIVPFVPKEQGVLPAPSSPEAKQAAAIAKASQVEPEAEVGGEPDFGDEKKSAKKKGK